MLLEKASEKVAALPQDEQDAIASQILVSLADEDVWKKRFVVKRVRGELGSQGKLSPLLLARAAIFRTVVIMNEWIRAACARIAGHLSLQTIASARTATRKLGRA